MEKLFERSKSSSKIHRSKKHSDSSSHLSAGPGLFPAPFHTSLSSFLSPPVLFSKGHSISPCAKSSLNHTNLSPQFLPLQSPYGFLSSRSDTTSCSNCSQLQGAEFKKYRTVKKFKKRKLKLTEKKLASGPSEGQGKRSKRKRTDSLVDSDRGKVKVKKKRQHTDVDTESSHKTPISSPEKCAFSSPKRSYSALASVDSGREFGSETDTLMCNSDTGDIVEETIESVIRSVSSEYEPLPLSERKHKAQLRDGTHGLLGSVKKKKKKLLHKKMNKAR